MQTAKTLLPKNKMSIVQPTAEGTIFQCVECLVKFVDKEKMELHLLLHNKEYRYLCSICGAGLKRKEHLDRHTLGHQEVRPHVCVECGKGFKRKEHLNIHKTIHTGDKSQVCPFCQRSFYRKDHLQKHLLTHNKQFIEALTDIDMEVKHEILDEPETKDSLMSADETSVKCENGPAGVATPERPYACQYCEKTYKRKDHLKIHSVTHQAKDKVCSECGKAFHKEDQLLCHMNTHIRPEGYADGSLLEEHHSIPVDHTQIQITPIDDNDLLVPLPARAERRPHECPICFKRFKRRQHLKVHANVHARALQPTIWCSLCSVGFTSNDQFENHECTAETDEQSGAPEQPRAAAARKENQPQYNTHSISEGDDVSYIQDETPASGEPPEERLIPRPQRVYVCKYCAKPFRRKDHYKIHLHIHTGVKSFFCVDCGKGFYRKDHLQKHALVHYKNKQAVRVQKQLPALFPITLFKKKDQLKPEITITAPSNAKLRVPLQIKVPYQMVRAPAGEVTTTHNDQQ